MKKLDMVVVALLILGGINWGFWGLFQFSLINYVISNELVDRIIYFLIGGAGVYVIVRWHHFFAKK